MVIDVKEKEQNRNAISFDLIIDRELHLVLFDMNFYAVGTSHYQ